MQIKPKIKKRSSSAHNSDLHSSVIQTSEPECYRTYSFKVKKIVSYVIMAVFIPIVIILGSLIFKDKQYSFICVSVAILSCIPFFISFEGREHSSTKLIIIAVMTALSIAGRLLFSMVPGFKPVTAMVIITAMYFGSEAGFMTGAMTALISNFYFGQGYWTPLQMFTWGIIGLISGLLAKQLKKNIVFLLIFGGFAGVLFSVLMDLWSVFWFDGGFNLSRFIANIISSAQFTIIYAVSNIVFLLLLAKPIGTKLQRIKEKYGI